jgi:hypothetical protein
MIPKSGCRLPACAKPGQRFVGWEDASAGEGRSEKIMLNNKLKRSDGSTHRHFASGASSPRTNMAVNQASAADQANAQATPKQR